MTETLERLTEEVRKLTPTEVNQLRTWLIGYQPSDSKSPGTRADWSDHADRVKEIFGDASPVRENVVLAMREEERF